MRLPAPLAIALIFFSTLPAAGGETGSRETIKFLRDLQAPSGGFYPAKASPGTLHPSLRATTAAVRALHYFGGEVPNRTACAQFVDRCFDAKTGCFADTPGGKADVFTTSVGMLAVVDLKMPADKYSSAVKFLEENARSFEDIRIAAAAFESLGKPTARKEEWLKEIRKLENADGTFGSGAGQARATGGATAAILRLGGKLSHPEKALEAMRLGQHKTGGFGKDESDDLETTYRIVRSLHMLKSRPDDVAALQAFIAKCRNADGGYGVSPGMASSASSTYFAAIVTHWLKK
jgi:hypothetical protein